MTTTVSPTKLVKSQTPDIDEVMTIWLYMKEAHVGIPTFTRKLAKRMIPTMRRMSHKRDRDEALENHFDQREHYKEM